MIIEFGETLFVGRQIFQQYKLDYSLQSVRNYDIKIPPTYVTFIAYV